MNIFVLDTSPELAARYHCDQHINSGISEAYRIMRAAHRILDDLEPPHKVGWSQMGCMKWARETDSNYLWLHSLFRHLCIRKVMIYKIPHKLAQESLSKPPANIPHGPLTRFFPQIPVGWIPTYNVVQAYRIYYYFRKRNFARKGPAHWTYGPPQWWIDFGGTNG